MKQREEQMSETLPNAILDHRNAFVGTAGAGKTYASKSAVEILLGRRWRVCIVDPLGVWYGLRSSADGSGPGFDVTIFGGAHGDLPLTEAAAPIIAEAIAGGQFSCIVDLSGLPSQGSRRRFMKAFAETLYAKNSEPLHLVLDEADLFCPQRPIEDIAQILGARIDEIVRRGRVKGFVPWLISQRPAVIHKDVLSQVDTLIAFKLTSSQDRDALGAWIEGQADRAEQKRIYAKLPTLKQGDCIVWSPADGILRDYRFPKARTFDSSRTPKRGERVAAPTGWSKPDLEALRAKLATVEQEAAENDPKALRTSVAELERQLADAALQATKQGQAADPAVIDRAREEGHQAGAQSGYQAGWRDGTAFAAERLEAGVDQILTSLTDLAGGIKAAEPKGDVRSGPPAPSIALPAQANTPIIRRPVASELIRPVRSDAIKPALQRVLDAIGWWRKIGHAPVERARAAVVAGYSPKASTFGVYVAELVQQGLVETSPGRVALTQAGLKVAHTPKAATRSDLCDLARSLLSPQEQRVFDVIYRTYPKDIRRDAVAEKVGLSPTASTSGVYIAGVAAYGLIESSGRGSVRAAAWLFP